jgi:hypothetical protein
VLLFLDYCAYRARGASKTRGACSDLGGDIPDKARRGQQALATLVKNEIARWAPIIKAANITQ